ncbi:MAG: ABC transporter permease [Anaerolineae bacterium]|nr:ABC transporter permease [Anaerolineae bacterium]MCA9896134.1 ABC transporter permease [Anaerolineae bacterium]MCB9459763.1 ABC transporter permease [Anaerolineaceae bacterium]
MNVKAILALIQKDLTLYFRNRFFAFITLLGLVAYIVIYLLMPTNVEEDLTIAVYAPTIPDIFIEFLTGNDITITKVDSEEALRQGVIDLEYPAGLVLPGEVITGIARGEDTTVTIYLASDVPEEYLDALRTVLSLAFNELSYTLSGDPLNLDIHEEVIGPDLAGQQLAMRDRLLPMLAVMVLVIEMMGLGSLIAEERAAGTLPALLITPISVSGLFVSKAVVGILLAFTQAAILMLFTGGLAYQPLLILATLLLGALLVTGLAFLVASFSTDMMSVIAWSMLLIIILVIPSVGVIFPGTLSNLARFIPSYYLFDTIHQVVNFDATWGAVSSNLVILLIMGIALMLLGIVVMERKLR